MTGLSVNHNIILVENILDDVSASALGKAHPTVTAGQSCPIRGELTDTLIAIRIRDALARELSAFYRTNALLGGAIPEITDRSRVSASFRIYTYSRGVGGATHLDAARREGRFVSTHSILLYINDDFTGGQTIFPDFGISITPRAGCALLFPQHHRHYGAAVIDGEKRVARCELMIEKPERS